VIFRTNPNSETKRMGESLVNATAESDGSPMRSPKRTGAITVLGLLLLVQGLGFFFLGGLHTLVIDIDWQLNHQDFLINIPLGLRGAAFIGLGVLALLASVGFLRLWSGAWPNAVMVQGLSLLLAIILYFYEKPFYIYTIMLYDVVMVIYLNYSEVTAAFLPERMVKDWGGIDER
jgi:hypothetical protein